MARYFLEVAYKGTRYSGFQVQNNAITIQSEVEAAFQTLHRQPVRLTGSSRTDAGVHALQNFFHFDVDAPVHPQAVYKLNAILPDDIVVKNIVSMPAEAHSRFDALSRSYAYRLHHVKNPFLKDTSLFYPYKLNIEALQEGAAFILAQDDFSAFSKTNTQVSNFKCRIFHSQWEIGTDTLVYRIEGNRFLRGMVRMLTATLLKMGRGKITKEEFETYFTGSTKCGVSSPSHALYLTAVSYRDTIKTSKKDFSIF